MMLTKDKSHRRHIDIAYGGLEDKQYITNLWSNTNYEKKKPEGAKGFLSNTIDKSVCTVFLLIKRGCSWSWISHKNYSREIRCTFWYEHVHSCQVDGWQSKPLYVHKPHSKNKKYGQEPFLVLQLVINRGLVSVSGGTNQYLEGPQL